MGACSQRGWAVGLGLVGQGQRAGLQAWLPPTVPFTLLYCTRLAMAFSASPPVWAGLRGDGEDTSACSALPTPHPRPGLEGTENPGLGASSREAHFRGTEDGLVQEFPGPTPRGYFVFS